MEKYEPQKFEKKWQSFWEQENLYKAEDNSKKEKFYCLDMFPYPSGEGLHVGHWRGYVLSDVIARYQKLQGKNVLHPMGWDAFGLPAENAAIKNKTHPEIYTKKAIDHFREQLKQTGSMFDWSREINTSDPEYYKWTQWLFLQLYKNGLAYRKNAPVNWCPSCQTVLANEQVVADACERCGTTVIQKNLTQWFFKITDFAENLLNDLETLDWPERTKLLQKNWIGRSEGTKIRFEVISNNEKVKTNEENLSIDVFTTRADTLFGCTYVVLAPEHSLVEKLKPQIKNYDEVAKYIEKAKKKSNLERQALQKEKTGVRLEGVKAINPINNEEVEVWIADYALINYGTGAVMAVPAHDERDFEFAHKFNIPIKEVIIPNLIQSTEPAKYRSEEPVIKGESVIVFIKHPKEEKYLSLDWIKDSWGAKTLLTGTIDDLTPEETLAKEIKEETGYQNFKISKKLGVIDGLFYHLPKKTNKLVRGHVYLVELKDEEKNEISPEEKSFHKIKWLTVDELKGFLTPLTHIYALDWLKNEPEAFVEDGSLMNSAEFDWLTSKDARQKITQKLKDLGLGDFEVNYRLRDWLISRQRYWGAPIPIIYCDKCGEVAVEEKDLPVELPRDVEFLPTGESPLKKSESFLNVKCPKCGGNAKRETDTMDTFVCSSWYYLRYTDPKNTKKMADAEKVKYWLPVDTYIGGIEHAILHLLYARFISKVLHKLNIFNYDPKGEPFKKLFNIGMIYLHGAKMSKSKGNIVSPDELIEKYGTDALRGYELFIGPPELDSEWQVSGISGISRFIDKIWQFFSQEFSENISDNPEVHRTINTITEEINSFKPNTAISHLMELFNNIKDQKISKEDALKINIVLAPFFPHLAEEIHEKNFAKGSIFNETWPKVNTEIIGVTKVKVPVQINGKVRTIIKISPNALQKEAEEEALKNENVKSAIAEGKILKTIYVSGKILNFVVK